MRREGFLGYLVSQYPAISHTFIFREVEGLRALGFNIKTASINTPKPLTEAEKEEAKNTFIVKEGSKVDIIKWIFLHPLIFFSVLLKAFWNLGFSLKNLFYLGEAILLGLWSQKNDIFHIHVHFANPAATVALIHSWINGIPYSLTIHGPDEFYNVDKNHLKLKFESSAFIVAISHYTASQIIKIAPVKPVVCPLGINLDQFPYIKRSWHEPRELLSIGRLHPNKGFKTLLEAVKGLKINLTIIGEGDEREALEGLKMDSVHLLGAKSQTEVIDFYQTADIFVLASFAEGLPVVLMEAMASGLPVLATQINAIPELIHNQENGLLVPPANPDALRKAIIQLIDHPEVAEKMAKEARLTVERDYNLDTNLEKLAKIFREKICSYSS